MNIRLAVTTVLIYSTIAFGIYLVTLWMHDNPVKAIVYPTEIYVNEKITFADSTKGASRLLWEFGNGEKSTKTKGHYTFRKAGNYLVRLSINKKVKGTYMVKVQEKPVVQVKKDTKITIYANKTGITGQKLHFKVLNSNIEWCEWYFGETGKIDAREAETFHSFAAAGTYTVKLITNLNPTYPVTHTIQILTPYKLSDNVAVKPKPVPAGGGGGAAPEEKPLDKLKLSIQSIANGGNFSSNYNFIIKNFLCSNPHAQVVVNGKPGIDIYSYCQSLQLGSGITIDQIVPHVDPKSNCTTKLTITQH